jgi:hypothetical protein
MNYDFQSHLDGGKYEKRVWFWPFKWFVEPYVLTGEEWDRCNCYFQHNYPVQYFLRETLGIWFHRNIVYPYKQVKWNVKGYICNPRKEMRKNLFPIRWEDLTETIVRFHLEAIIEFVEREKCFEHNDYSELEEHKHFAAQLKECYDYAKQGRKALHDKLEKAFDNIAKEGEYKVVYKEVNEIEAEIEMYDTKVCDWVIKNRKMFWV